MPYATASSSGTSQLVDGNSNPISEFGHVHGDGVPSNSHRLGTIAPNAQATYALSEDSVYEIAVYDNAAPDDGTAESILIKPGAAGVTIGSLAFASTDAFLMTTAHTPKFRQVMKKGQTHLAIGTLSTVSAKTLLIFARKLR